MLPPLPRRSGWAYYFARSPNRVSLPRKGRRVGLHIVLFEACSAFTRVTACTLAPSPIRDALSEGFSHFVTSIAAPVASGWSGCRVGLAPTGKRRLVTAHTRSGGHSVSRADNRIMTLSRLGDRNLRGTQSPEKNSLGENQTSRRALCARLEVSPSCRRPALARRRCMGPCAGGAVMTKILNDVLFFACATLFVTGLVLAAAKLLI